MDFHQFAALMREREAGEHSDEELRKRFAAIDHDKSGVVEREEFVYFALRDALARAAERVVDIFR
eukprot:6181915-Prymnesium_polylepis.1